MELMVKKVVRAHKDSRERLGLLDHKGLKVAKEKQ